MGLWAIDPLDFLHFSPARLHVYSALKVNADPCSALWLGMLMSRDVSLRRMEAVGEAPLRVRYLGGNYLPVRLVREASMQDVEKAIAGAVRLPVGTFFLKGADGGTTVMDSTLTGDWEAVRLLLTVGPPVSKFIAGLCRCKWLAESTVQVADILVEPSRVPVLSAHEHRRCDPGYLAGFLHWLVQPRMEDPASSGARGGSRNAHAGERLRGCREEHNGAAACVAEDEESTLLRHSPHVFGHGILRQFCDGLVRVRVSAVTTAVQKPKTI